MEFNRLLSQAISFYGEPGEKNFSQEKKKKKSKINTKTISKNYKRK